MCHQHPESSHCCPELNLYTVLSNGGSGVVDWKGQATVTRCSLSHNKEWGVFENGGQCDVSDSHMNGNGMGAIGEANRGKVKSSNNTGV